MKLLRAVGTALLAAGDGSRRADGEEGATAEAGDAPSAALAPRQPPACDAVRNNRAADGAPGLGRAQIGYSQPVGIPFAGGAGCVPVYGVIALPAAGVVTSGPPISWIAPFLSCPTSAPLYPPWSEVE